MSDWETAKALEIHAKLGLRYYNDASLAVIAEALREARAAALEEAAGVVHAARGTGDNDLRSIASAIRRLPAPPVSP